MASADRPGLLQPASEQDIDLVLALSSLECVAGILEQKECRLLTAQGHMLACKMSASTSYKILVGGLVGERFRRTHTTVGHARDR